MVTLLVSDVRKCMNELLVKDRFDFFLLQEATVSTFSTFTIDGHRIDDFYTDTELEEIDEGDTLMPYEMYRGHIYDIIKGNKTPVSFKIILSLPNRIVTQLITASELSIKPEGTHLVVIFRFSPGSLTVTTGISLSEFTMDKSLENAFDKWIMKFLVSVGIDVERQA